MYASFNKRCEESPQPFSLMDCAIIIWGWGEVEKRALHREILLSDPHDLRKIINPPPYGGETV